MKLFIPVSCFDAGCQTQRDKLRQLWPELVPLTPEAVRTAAQADLDFSWAASQLLKNSAFDEFSDFRADANFRYQQVTKPFFGCIGRRAAHDDPEYVAFTDVAAAAALAYRLTLGHTLLRLLLVPGNCVVSFVERI